MAKVFINPGHAPSIDSGATNPNMGLLECNIALAIGKKVKYYLEAAGCEVQLLQSDNLNGESPDYPCVCGAANDWPADILISLHCNAANTLARGTEAEIYNFGGDGERLANCIMGQLVPTIQKFDGDCPSRGIKQRTDLCVLRRTNMPATLIEIAFIDNDRDAAILADPKAQDEIAKAIARGVTDYFA